MSQFHGKFVSDPLATVAAENKLLQLSIAERVGLRVPPTYITNSLADLPTELGAPFIAKSLGPVSGAMVEARVVYHDSLQDPEIAAVPTIFQSYVEGDTHVRAIVLGDEVIWIEFRSEAVDWRWNVPSEMKECEGDARVKKLLVSLCRHLGLRMGVADLKYDNQQVLHFLEVNPQGQFLFIDERTPVGIGERFADFLLEEGR